MTTTMHASAREMRHMVGRYLHARRCPAFAVNAVRDAILAAQAEGFDAVSEMERIRDRYPAARTSLAVSADAGGPVLDGAGTPAPILAPALVDELALALAAGETRVRVRGVPGIAMIDALHDYAAVRGVAFEFAAEGDDAATLAVSTRTRFPVEPAAGAAGPSMERALREGYELGIEQFWRLFHESNEALTPDSEVSRRHAGSQLYDEHGNLIGEVSEETYLHLRSQAGDPSRAVLA